MSLKNTIGQNLPVDPEIDVVKTRIDMAVKSLNENRAGIHRWFWKGLFAFNLILASLVFWLGIVPSLI